MSTRKPWRKPRQQRQRVRRVSESTDAAASRSASPLFYALFGLLVVGGIAVLFLRFFNGTPGTASNVPIDRVVRPLSVPTGQTPEGYWYKGVAEAPVTVVEFGDYQCPSCAAAFRQIEGGIDNDYVNAGTIRFVFHDFPLPIHANAAPAAGAARCAGDQGKYWALHDVLYSRQGEWAADSDVANRMKTYASELGLDRAAFGQCLDGGKYDQAIREAITDGTMRGIDTTPTYLVDGKAVAANGLRAAIDAALAAKGR